jgi:hypothetical protein
LGDTLNLGDALTWLGKWRIEFAGRRWEVFNKITDAGLAWYIDLLRGVGEPGFKYIALGTDSTPAAYTDTRLGAEQVRKAISAFNPTLPVLESVVIFLDTEANFRIREIGIFAGATATSEPNTGVLVARTIVDIEKTNIGSLKITREDRLGRVS